MSNSAQAIHLKSTNNQPVFRIGLFKDQEHIDFRVMGAFSLVDGENKPLIDNIKTDLKWRIKIKDSKPGKEHYFLVLYESFKKDMAEQKLKSAQLIDKSAELRVLGGSINLDKRQVNNNTKYVVVAGNYPTDIAARKAFKRFQPEFIPYVEKHRDKAPGGQLEAFDAEYDKSTEVKDVLRIIPKDLNSKIKIFAVRTFDDVLQRDYYADQVFNGILEFRLDINGNLMAISEVPLELYLERVIHSEIGSDLPPEFSKALAIVCRSEAMARINHQCLGDPFDYTNIGETLRYFGTDFDDENIIKAVQETAGQVIFLDDHIRDTPFHLICGGHTEDSHAATESSDEAHFLGKYDWHTVPETFTSLQNEKMVSSWIESRPETWCNLKGRKLPPSLERVKKFFRWEVDYSRRELEDIIRKKTGEDIGILFEIIPISRGRSGRLFEIELIGSLKNYRIRGQLNIREALSYDYLPSSCFVVERDLDDTGTPINFTFVGAGQGHGVGMCKTGGAVMAMEGFTSEQILEHYFESCQIRSIYDINLDKK